MAVNLCAYGIGCHQQFIDGGTSKIAGLSTLFAGCTTNAALLDLRKSLPDYKKERNGDTHLARHLGAIQKSAGGLRAALVTNARGTVIAASTEDLVGKTIIDQGYFLRIRRTP